MSKDRKFSALTPQTPVYRYFKEGFAASEAFLLFNNPNLCPVRSSAFVGLLTNEITHRNLVGANTNKGKKPIKLPPFWGGLGWGKNRQINLAVVRADTNQNRGRCFPLINSKYQVSEFSARPAGCLKIKGKFGFPIPIYEHRFPPEFSQRFKSGNPRFHQTDISVKTHHHCGGRQP